jgi:hypothetical protein
LDGVSNFIGSEGGGVGAAGGFDWAGAVGSWPLSSGRSNAVKSVSVNGGAGAEGEMVAFRAMEIGGRAEAGNTRVGAVEPDNSGFRLGPAPVPF